eukprot:3758475-Amphidinium_carterae.2
MTAWSLTIENGSKPREFCCPGALRSGGSVMFQFVPVMLVSRCERELAWAAGKHGHFLPETELAGAKV